MVGEQKTPFLGTASVVQRFAAGDLCLSPVNPLPYA